MAVAPMEWLKGSWRGTPRWVWATAGTAGAVGAVWAARRRRAAGSGGTTARLSAPVSLGVTGQGGGGLAEGYGIPEDYAPGYTSPTAVVSAAPTVSTTASTVTATPTVTAAPTATTAPTASTVKTAPATSTASTQKVAPKLPAYISPAAPGKVAYLRQPAYLAPGYVPPERWAGTTTPVREAAAAKVTMETSPYRERMRLRDRRPRRPARRPGTTTARRAI